MTPREINLRAAEPGSLSALDQLGHSWSPLTTEEGDTVAAIVSDGDLTAVRDQLIDSFPERGLWPLWIDTELEEDVITGPMEVTGDAEELLRNTADVFSGYSVDPEPWMLPMDSLASATVDGTSHQYQTATLDGSEELLVVPAARPADVVAALGWDGPVNHGLDGGQVSAVLRSWEDRFGAIPFGIGFDTLFLQVAAPPTDDAQVEILAREHYFFCPDNIDQGVGTLEKYFPIVRHNVWSFWWD